MADVKRKDEAPDPQEDSGKETRTKGVSRRGFLIGAGMGVSGLLVAGGTHFMNNLPDVAVERLLQNAFASGRDAKHFEDDALYVITTGTGAPLPDPLRVGPQAVVIAGDQMLVFDAGPGSTRQLSLTGLNLSSMSALFLTHYHSDHISDLGELMLQHWASGGATEPLPIYGPPGVEEVVAGFTAAYQLDRSYRIAHHDEEVVPPSGFGGVAHTFDLGADLMSSAVVYEAGDVQVIAFNVDHPPVVPAVGFRVNYKGRSVMITGDTIYSDSLIHHAMGADLMVSDSLNHKMSQAISEAGKDMDNNLSSVTEDIQESHIKPEEAALVAREAGVPVLLITHVLPPVPKLLINPFLRDARAIYSGEVRMANDGTMAKLPVNSDQIIISELFG
ncbi:MBL fold metallo-hydrolase [Candidatus Chloroploca sp. Khr17]|uniref:MBL fold metallo-hydrolase n=1 Tax=Candidatus Chloroploca sp. Khr17 TaxID=2496869 RepID=UPI00101B7439|nr:MBL fold metallo-hydrolase [Candidatus Chloroploca sp. Khr17]